jgi:integrase
LKIYQHKVAESAKRLGYSQLRLSLHSMRHGGRSTDVLEQRIGLDEVMKRGHWISMHSVRRYEKYAVETSQPAFPWPA